MTASPADLLDEWLAARLEGDAHEWLRQKIDGAVRGGADSSFLLAFGTAPRKVGRAALALGTEELAAARGARPGWQPDAWSVDQAARTLLVLALPAGDAGEFRAAFDGLCDDGDLGELVALYQSLPLLPHPEAFRDRAAEGIRTNMKPVFEAVALRNPYPAEQLDDAAWNQLVLKCLFVESPLRLVHGIDARVTPALGGMLCDYAHERWAAGRPVSPELWRPVGPVATGRMLEDLARVLATGTDRERAAVLLAARGNPGAAALLAKHAALRERLAAEYPTWDAIG